MKYKIVMKPSRLDYPGRKYFYRVVKNDAFESTISDLYWTLEEAEKFLEKLHEVEKINEKYKE